MIHQLPPKNSTNAYELSQGGIYLRFDGGFETTTSTIARARNDRKHFGSKILDWDPARCGQSGSISANLAKFFEGTIHDTVREGPYGRIVNYKLLVDRIVLDAISLFRNCNGCFLVTIRCMQ